jgi:ABC-type sugar transport system ATPase subunit
LAFDDGAVAGHAALRCEGVSKRYGGVQALEAIDFAVEAGSVHALLGENGAGKSTLIRIVSGTVEPDSGVLRVGGVAQQRLTPSQARRLGIATVFQETSLLPSLSVLENLFAGRYLRTRHGLLDWPRMRRQGARVLERLGVALDLDATVDELDRSSAQIVEIARALGADAAILIMDEPTAALSAAEAERLFEIVDAVKAAGTAVIYVSHHLEEIFRVADRVTVLRDGEVQGSAATRDIDEAWIVERMIGRSLQAPAPRTPRQPRDALLKVDGLTHARAFRDVSFAVGAGEVVALAGLIGSGRYELMRALLGLEPHEGGHIELQGQRHRPRAGAHVRAGIGFVPQNRQREGLVAALPAAVNLGLSTLSSRCGVLDAPRLRAQARRLFAALQVRPDQPELPAASFSGGNQQKLVIGRSLLAEPRLLLIEEPTQGVDVGAKEEIHRVIDRAVADGMGVLVASSDLPEITRLADRVLVLRKGRLVQELPGGSAPPVLLAAIAGQAAQEERADAIA